jgi:hypothetical protein
VTTPDRRLRRILVYYTFGTACFVALLIGTVLVLQDRTLQKGSLLSSIGVNLIASVVFALMFVVLSNWAQDRNIMETINEGFTDLTDRLTESISETNQLFLPRSSYPAVNPDTNFGDEYNYDVTMSLEHSDFFAFHGPSARYVAARLRKVRHHPQQIRIAMINPANRRAISRRAFDRAAWPKSKSQAAEMIERELENELLMNVVSLFDCRRLCPIEILYTDDTAVYRYVMLDQSVFVSWYHSPQSAQMEMPESYQFGRESFIYSTFRMDLMRKFEISSSRAKVTFEATQHDGFLIDHLAQLVGRVITAEHIEQWRAQHHQDSAGFTSYLDGIYRDLAGRNP